MPDDLQQPGEGTVIPTSSTTPPAGQSENWEERFKGLQRTYNQQQQKLSELEGKIAAKDTVNANAVQRSTQLETEIATLRNQYEGQLATRSAEAKTTLDELEAAKKELQTHQGKIQQYENRNKVRQQLASPEFRDMLGWYESGNLSLVDENGQPLEGDAFSERVNSFRSQLQQHFTGQVTNDLRGTTPPSSTPPTGPLAGMNEDQLNQWLLDNPNNPSYSQVEEQYTSMIEKRMAGITSYEVTS